MDQLERWLGGLGEDEGRQTIQALTKVGHKHPHLNMGAHILTSFMLPHGKYRRVCGTVKTNA